MKTRRLFPVRIESKNPEIIATHERCYGPLAFDSKTYNGTLYRVTPQTADEIFALQMLEHREEKFAPATGDGVLVTFQALKKFA